MWYAVCPIHMKTSYLKRWAKFTKVSICHNNTILIIVLLYYFINPPHLVHIFYYLNHLTHFFFLSTYRLFHVIICFNFWHLHVSCIISCAKFIGIHNFLFLACFSCCIACGYIFLVEEAQLGILCLMGE